MAAGSTEASGRRRDHSLSRLRGLCDICDDLSWLRRPAQYRRSSQPRTTAAPHPTPRSSLVDDSDADLSPQLVSPPVATFAPIHKLYAIYLSECSLQIGADCLLPEGADFSNKFRNCVNQTLPEIVSVDVERFRVWRDFMGVHKI
ncbi:LOW QUALITY PROTEIN: hypothetical protein U9M48_001820 [Paspalum notatum var. saurae]|uniref:Uncharacterized protein n=1 Tax=Paspalum notatum var. saurae TaxID=547442 RepID=A0AAQ3PG90_PASNO